MQLLSDATIAPAKPDRVARQLIETVPLVMQFMRRQMRRASKQELSIPQLRTLYFVSIHDRPSLSCAADFIGLSLPAMSRLVDALVRKGFITRTACEDDRRHVRLGISAAGRAALDVAWKGTHARLSKEVDSMSSEDRATLASAMNILRARFHPDVVKD
jgi:DNA-binding MarR family transcriptional regulator